MAFKLDLQSCVNSMAKNTLFQRFILYTFVNKNKHFIICKYIWIGYKRNQKEIYDRFHNFTGVFFLRHPEGRMEKLIRDRLEIGRK